jgi:hypothetical protein
MDRNPITVLGIYPTRIDLENAFEAFRDAGFQIADISLLLPEKMSTEDLFPEEAANRSEDAASTAEEVAEIDGPLGWLNEFILVAIPGEGKYLVAGPFLETLEKTDLEGAAGGLASALITIGIPESETGEYTRKIAQGGALFFVHCDNAERADTARNLHGILGGTSIFSTGKSEAGSGKTRKPISRGAGR